MKKKKTRKWDIVCKAEAGASIFKRGVREGLIEEQVLEKRTDAGEGAMRRAFKGGCF